MPHINDEMSDGSCSEVIYEMCWMKRVGLFISITLSYPQKLQSAHCRFKAELQTVTINGLPNLCFIAQIKYKMSSLLKWVVLIYH